MSIEEKTGILIKNNLRALIAIANSKNGFSYLKECSDTQEYIDLNTLSLPEYKILLKGDNKDKSYYTFAITRIGKIELKKHFPRRN